MRSIVTFLAAMLLLGLGSGAQVPREREWVPLFNGKDLTGWKIDGKEKWFVDEGTIICESAAQKYGYLTTAKTYRDFDLRLKFKGEAAGNSGVFFHARIVGIDPQRGPDIEGMQVEVDPNLEKHIGGLYESGGRGWVVTPTQEGERALKPGEWSDLQASVRGNHIVTHLNGLKVADYTDPAPKFTDGVIGLQVHTGGGVKMRWKERQHHQERRQHEGDRYRRGAHNSIADVAEINCKLGRQRARSQLCQRQTFDVVLFADPATILHQALLHVASKRMCHRCWVTLRFRRGSAESASSCRVCNMIPAINRSPFSTLRMDGYLLI